MHEIDLYIAQFPEEVQARLQELRRTIRLAAPDAQEVISYKMPAYKLHGILVYFAGYKNHIGFYPTPSGIELFKDKLVGFKCSKGAMQFPHDKPLPLDLVTAIVQFRAAEEIEKMKLKKRK